MFVSGLRVRSYAALFAAFVFAASWMFAAPARAAESRDVVVTFTTAQAARRAAATADGGVLVAPTVASLSADAGTIDELSATPGVVAVESDVAFHATDLATQPTDPCFVAANQCDGLDAWQFGDLGMADLWARTHGASTTIAVVDGGVDASVPDIAAKLIAPEIDLSDAHDGPSDHGTAVAALAAGALDNGVASGGVAWDSQLLSIKVLDRSGTGRLSAVAAGVVRATDLGARVINLSLSGQLTTALATAVNYAVDHGVIVVAAAGNDGTDTPTVALSSGPVDGGYPARHPGVIAVGATTRGHAIAPFSDFGSWVDVFAPGVDLPAPVVGGRLERFSGTSAAAPLVSGIAALLASASPDAQSSDIETALHATGIAINGRLGAVRANAAALAADDDLFPDGPSSPTGVVDGVGPAPAGMVLTGWTVDPNAHDTLDIHTYVDGRFAGVIRADVPRPDVASVLPGYGAPHGFTVQLPLPPGAHKVCVYGINVGAGVNALIACVTPTVSTLPFGALDGTARTPTTATVRGWVIDPTTSAPARARVTIDGVTATTALAAVPRPDVSTAFPFFGDAHGYRIDVAVTPGPHTLCVIGLGPLPAASAGLGCRPI